LDHLEAVHTLNPEAGPDAVVPLPDRPEVHVSYKHLLMLEQRMGPDHSFFPDGADRPYLVRKLLEGVRRDAANQPEPSFSIHVNGQNNRLHISTGPKSPITSTETTGATQMQPTPQERYRHLYTLLAFGTGTAFLIALLVISLVQASPTPPQLRVQASILALAAAGFATVMSGLMNITANLGTQVAIGATGGFAVLVLFYLQNPAVLQ
jgi:hypothetical protein